MIDEEEEKSKIKLDDEKKNQSPIKKLKKELKIQLKNNLDKQVRNIKQN